MGVLLAHLGESVCVCGDVCEVSACDARLRDVCEVIGSEILVSGHLRDGICNGLPFLRFRGLCILWLLIVVVVEG